MVLYIPVRLNKKLHKHKTIQPKHTVLNINTKTTANVENYLHFLSICEFRETHLKAIFIVIPKI